ncbi:hypothetical protein AVEN_28603-1 [Araneus ventricosus]|uniref:Tc1-like transposase DDE domain-containing protein n=1 Tax=Araneus ventricosus TaxID=182803 RepID=A0A4Y2DF60_ARAVE|nr:hypothetical protein AVEN_28603-1 [Araneus ventricosus]
MRGHGTFCGQTKPISISKVLSILKNCRIWARANPFQMQPLPPNSQKVTMWCGFTAAFFVGPFFFKEIGPSGPVTCGVNGTRFESLLCNQLIPALTQRGCVDSTIFMQDGAPPHIATPVKHLLKLHFGNDRIDATIT